MTATPDDSVRCRCGSSTYPVVGGDDLRTCAACGYLISHCRCGRTGWTARAKFRIPSIGDRARAALGAGVLTAFGTVFALTLFTSPFVAVLGLGIPLGLGASFFGEWLREEGPPQVAEIPLTPRTEQPKKRVNGR